MVLLAGIAIVLGGTWILVRATTNRRTSSRRPLSLRASSSLAVANFLLAAATVPSLVLLSRSRNPSLLWMAFLVMIVAGAMAPWLLKESFVRALVSAAVAICIGAVVVIGGFSIGPFFIPAGLATLFTANSAISDVKG